MAVNVKRRNYGTVVRHNADLLTRWKVSRVAKAGGWQRSLVVRKRARKRKSDERGGRDDERSRGTSCTSTRGRRRNGTGECSLEPITVARPGVRQTLYSFSNNANKRASILRFYRVALSVFDNGPSGQRRSRAPPCPKQCRVHRGTTDFNGIDENLLLSPWFTPCQRVLHTRDILAVRCKPFRWIPRTNSLRDCPFRGTIRFETLDERVFTLDNQQPNFHYSLPS